MIGRGTSKLRRTLVTALSAAALTLVPAFVSVAHAAPEKAPTEHAAEASPKTEGSGEAKIQAEKKPETKASSGTKAKKSAPKGERATKHAVSEKNAEKNTSKNAAKKSGKKKAHSKAKGAGSAPKKDASSADSGGILLSKPVVNEPDAEPSEGPTKKASVSTNGRGRGSSPRAHTHEKGASRSASSAHVGSKGAKSSKHETKPAKHEAETKPARHEAETKPAKHETETKPAKHEAETKPARHESDTRHATHDTKPASHEVNAGSGHAKKASKKASSRSKSSKRREKKGERGDKVSSAHPCFGPAVTMDRAGLEPENFPLVTCKGEPLTEARDRLSLLARPWGLIRPDHAPAASGERAGSRGAKTSSDHEVDPLEVAPGVRRLDEGLVTRVSAVTRKFPGKLVSIVSGYRPQSRGSLHQAGRAIDLRVAGVTNVDLVAFCKTIPDTGCGFYPNSSFVHIDVRTPGTGSVSWIDASGPGEGPRYVSSWPEPATQAPPFAPPASAEPTEGGHEARASHAPSSPRAHTTTTASTTATPAPATRPASCVEPSAPSSSNRGDETDVAPLFEDPPY